MATINQATIMKNKQETQEYYEFLISNTDNEDIKNFLMRFTAEDFIEEHYDEEDPVLSEEEEEEEDPHLPDTDDEEEVDEEGEQIKTIIEQNIKRTQEENEEQEFSNPWAGMELDELLKKHKMTMEDLDTMIELKKESEKKPTKKKEKKEKKGGGGKAKGREAEFRFIAEKGGIIEHKLKGHTAEATYIGNEKFRFIFNGDTKIAKISGFCKAHAEELIRTGTPCSLAYNGWDACNIKGWGNKGQWGQ